MIVFVIGGGPAGMIAAANAAKNGHTVTLFERNEKLGKKLYITGKAASNVTKRCERLLFLRLCLETSISQQRIFTF
jgi:predicted flavoprotein YhiN